MYTINSTWLDISKIADSGQCFRMNRIDDNMYRALAMDRLVYIQQVSVEEYELFCTKKEYESFWKNYLDMGTDYEEFSKDIPRSDKFLTKASVYSKGIRILRQDPWEMLISFIISQRRSIPAIKTSIEKLCEKFGEKISDGRGGYCYAFPCAKRLATAELDDILACSVGYRAQYILEAARQVASGAINLDALQKLDDENLLKALMSIYGVGVKVANCIMLFGYHRIGAFPIDVWIQRMIDTHYDGHFPIEKYEGYAGVLQQYIFFYGREMARAK